MSAGGGVTLVMVITEVADMGVSTITKAALTKGLSQFILTVYSSAIGVFVLLLISYFIFSRNRTLTPLTFPVLCKLFLLGLISCCLSLLSATAVGFGSPTLSSAMSDLTPAFTFLLAMISRMEKADLRIRSSQAKSIGTFVSIAGALTVTLYKGQRITNQNNFVPSMNPNWVVGGIFSAGSAMLLAVVFIMQAWIAKDYPEEQMIILITYTFVTIFSGIVSLFVEKDPNAWTLKLDIRLLAIVSVGVFCVSFRNVVHVWAIRKKGPVYTSMFKPLGMVIAMAMGYLFLGESLYMGSVIGAIIIGIGFYAVLWGKAQEEEVSVITGEKSSNRSNGSCHEPLLTTLKTQPL